MEIHEEDDWYITEPLKWFEAAGALFCPVRPHSKVPAYQAWQTSPFLMREILPHVRDGANVGMLCGALSNGLCVLDIDIDLHGFLEKFPHFIESPRIIRHNAELRAKFLIRITDDCPPPKKWKPDPHLPPRAEWLSTGNQAVIPPSLHPSGAVFVLEYADKPIPEMTAAQFNEVWRGLTGTSLLKENPSMRDQLLTGPHFASLTTPIDPYPTQPPPQSSAPDNPTLVPLDRIKQIICERFDMVAYACYMTGSEAKREGKEWRVLAQGGLLIDVENGRWNTFAIDGMGHIGGDCFDLIAFLNWRTVKPKGAQWREVLRLGAAYLGIQIAPPSAASGKSGAVGGDSGASGGGGSMGLAQVWQVMGDLKVLWDGWLVGSFVTLVGGIPGAGKSSFVLKVVADFLEDRLPNGQPVPPDFAGRNVVYSFAEGYAEHSQALRAWGISDEALARIHVPYRLGAEEGAVPNFSFPLDEAGKAVLESVCATADPAIIVIDGMRAAMVGEEGNSKEADEFFYFLQALASRHKASLILTHHLTKEAMRSMKEGKAPGVEMVRGSSVIIGRCRAIALIDMPDPADPASRRVTLDRASNGTQRQEIAFHMLAPQDGVTFLAQVPQSPAATKKAEAERFILDELAMGALSYQELVERMEQSGLGISESTMREARVALSRDKRIVMVTEGRAGRKWIVPPSFGGVEAIVPA
jgi:hypothetical protein